MKFLFDTHIFLWAFDNHPHLSAEARYLLGEYDEELYFSPVNVWEIANKAGTKHPLDTTTEEFRQSPMDGGFRELPVTSRHAAVVETLPRIHGDPFDRMLVAQAMVEGCILVTHDDNVAKYGPFVRRV